METEILDRSHLHRLKEEVSASSPWLPRPNSARRDDPGRGWLNSNTLPEYMDALARLEASTSGWLVRSDRPPAVTSLG